VAVGDFSVVKELVEFGGAWRRSGDVGHEDM
jgi:hypothetical protein